MIPPFFSQGWFCATAKFHLLIQNGLLTLFSKNLFSECTLVRGLSMEDDCSDLVFPSLFYLDEFDP